MATLFEIFSQKGVLLPVSEKCSLDIWLNSILHIPLDKLDIGDICKLLRQNIVVCEISDVVLQKILDNPLDGFSYDGELLDALTNLNINEIKSCQTKYIKIFNVVLTFLQQQEWGDLDKTQVQSLITLSTQINK